MSGKRGPVRAGIEKEDAPELPSPQTPAAAGPRLRDHGGNLDCAIRAHGGRAEDWIDLSTGINRLAFPLPDLPAHVWTGLPTRADTEALVAAARRCYRTDAPMLAVAGAQAAIQLLPRLSSPRRVRVLSPTYNEHAAAWRSSGWQVEEVGAPQELAGADVGIIVNPNNPDGRLLAPDRLIELAGKVGLLVVDESFADATPEVSLAPAAGREGLIVLRSLGKFYGLAGVRLGFVMGPPGDVSRLEEFAGPWAVSGPAIAVGMAALSDRAWARATAERLGADARRLDGLACGWAGWRLIGGTALFRLYEVPDAAATQEHLARHRIWSRIFPSSETWLRLGLPGREAEWERLATALKDGARGAKPAGRGA